MLGMSILPSGNFNPDEIMPICLPPSKKYEDSNRGKIENVKSKEYDYLLFFNVRYYIILLKYSSNKT